MTVERRQINVVLAIMNKLKLDEIQLGYEDLMVDTRDKIDINQDPASSIITIRKVRHDSESSGN